MSAAQQQETVLGAAIKDFKRSVEITRDVRFQANLRLTRRQRTSAYIISLLSLYVIALSLLPNIVSLHPYQSQILLACSVVLSAFIIFTSLIDSSQNFFHQGELLHQCARKIATVHHELKMIDALKDPEIARDELKALQKRYQNALDDCPVNHDNVDFYREIASKPDLFPDQYRGHWRWGFVKWNRMLAFVIGNSWMVPHLLAFIGVSYIVYATIFASSAPIAVKE